MLQANVRPVRTHSALPQQYRDLARPLLARGRDNGEVIQVNTLGAFSLCPMRVMGSRISPLEFSRRTGEIGARPPAPLARRWPLLSNCARSRHSTKLSHFGAFTVTPGEVAMRA